MAKRSDGQFARRKHDVYDTPDNGMSILLPHLAYGATFVEPCAGVGKMVDYFVKNGHHCVGAYDIEPRRGDIIKGDILAGDISSELLSAGDYIITNPPWTARIKHEMIDIFAAIKPTWLLFDADWAFTLQAQPYLEYCCKIVATPRLKWIADSKFSAKDNTAWYLFDKSFSGQTVFVGRQK